MRAESDNFLLYWQRHIIITRAFIVNKKRNNTIYKLGKVDDRIQILQLAGSRHKRKTEIEVRKMVLHFKLTTNLKIRLQNSRNILGCL